MNVSSTASTSRSTKTGSRNFAPPWTTRCPAASIPAPPARCESMSIRNDSASARVRPGSGKDFSLRSLVSPEASRSDSCGRYSMLSIWPERSCFASAPAARYSANLTLEEPEFKTRTAKLTYDPWHLCARSDRQAEEAHELEHIVVAV